MCKSIWTAACVAALLAACQPVGIYTGIGKYRKETVIEPNRSGADSARTETAVYICGVEYPPGYDWIRDTSYKTVEKTLFLLRNGERIVSVPAGPASETGTEPDMHRILDAHLYSDGVTETETVIRRDGQELFRFEGRERILSMLVLDGKVHTLGTNRNGKGFSYRIDGEPVYVRGTGEAVGGLCLDGKIVCFSYFDDGLHHVRDGVSERVAMPSGMNAVFDARTLNGEIRVVFSKKGETSVPYLKVGDAVSRLGKIRNGWTLTRARFADGTDSLRIKGTRLSPDGRRDVLWTGKDKETVYSSKRIFDFYFDGDRYGYVAEKADGTLCIRDGKR